MRNTCASRIVGWRGGGVAEQIVLDLAPMDVPAGLRHPPLHRRILFRLQEATHPGSADAPGFRLHPLKGDRAGQWSARVTGNWRVVFRFEDGEAVDVDLIDCH